MAAMGRSSLRAIRGSRRGHAIVLLAGLLFAIAAPVTADVLKGRVADLTGTPIGDADFDVFTPAGDLMPQDDNSDADGSYEIILPPGYYDVVCEPRIASGLAPSVRLGVFVNGETRLDWALPASTRVIGRVTGPSGPVEAVDLDFDRLSDGARQPALGDITSRFGTFATYISPGTYRVSFYPTESSGLAPARIDSVTLPTADTLGVSLVPGTHVDGTVLSPTGEPVAGARLSFRMEPDGRRVPALGDHSLADGRFRSTVAPGRYRVLLTPPRGSGLLTLKGPSLDLTGDLTWDPVLESGFTLSGRVTDPSGRPLVGADWDAFQEPSGVEVPTGDDDTDYEGLFALALSPGTYRLRLVPPAESGLDTLLFNDVTVSSDRRLDVSYAGAPPSSGIAIRPAVNPSHGGGALWLTLARAGPVRVDLFDVAGRRLRTLLNGHLDAGVHRLEWDGRNAAGERIGAGVIFVRAALDGVHGGARWVQLP